MFDTAMDGNVTMMIWLSKQMLGYSDKVEKKLEHSGEVKSNFNRKEALKQLFKTEKSRALSLELAEELCQAEEQVEKKRT